MCVSHWEFLHLRVLKKQIKGIIYSDEEGEPDGARGCDSRLYSLKIVFFRHVIRVHEESLQRVFIMSF